jgi:hypothetical protein
LTPDPAVRQQPFFSQQQPTLAWLPKKPAAKFCIFLIGRDCAQHEGLHCFPMKNYRNFTSKRQGCSGSVAENRNF